MISQLYPTGHPGDDHERALDRALDGRHAAVLDQRRRAVDASPLARWIEARGPAHHRLGTRGGHIAWPE